MSNEPWKDTPEDRSPTDGRVKFGRKAIAWYRLALREFVSHHGHFWGVHADEVDALVAWLEPWESADNDDRYYARYVVAEAFAGRGFKSGEWQLHPKRLEKDMGEGLEAIRAERARAADRSISTLEAWLRADIAGSLHYAGAKGGSIKLDGAIRRRLVQQKKDRRKKPCVRCGKRFVRGAKTSDRCVSCRAVTSGQRAENSRTASR